MKIIKTQKYISIQKKVVKLATKKAKKGKKTKKWMQKATTDKTEGSFTAYCKRQGFDGVTDECIAKGKNSKNPTTRKRATLAETFRRTSKRKKNK